MGNPTMQAPGAQSNEHVKFTNPAVREHRLQKHAGFPSVPGPRYRRTSLASVSTPHQMRQGLWAPLSAVKCPTEVSYGCGGDYDYSMVVVLGT